MSYEYAVYCDGKRATGFFSELSPAEAYYEERVALLKRDGYVPFQTINDRRGWHVSSTLERQGEYRIATLVRLVV